MSMSRGLLLASLLLSAPSLAGAAVSRSPDVAQRADSGLSQIGFRATLSLAALQASLRLATAAAVGEAPPPAQTHRRSGVSVTVSPQVLAERLSVSGNRRGELHVGLPVEVRVRTAFSGGSDLAVDPVGCGRTTFTVKAVFSPRISDNGRLGYALTSVSNDNRDYVCRIESKGVIDAGKHVKEFFESLGGKRPDYSKAVNVNVSAKIQQRLRTFAGKAFAARVEDFNGLMPDDRAIAGLLQRPALFGNALALGIDGPRVRVERVSANGDDYRVSGVIEGRPRLVFGDTWGEVGGARDSSPSVAGFRLPARLMFPTDPALRPDPAPQAASGCVGGFRLRKVPDRTDLAVLQRCARPGYGGVIWLSGSNAQPTGRVHAYDRRMSNVLREVLEWLADDSLWRGVHGIAELRRQVAWAHERLLAFQQDTRLPLDERGVLYFSDLAVDLRRVWVTGEAIQADVELSGNARLEIRLAL